MDNHKFLPAADSPFKTKPGPSLFSLSPVSGTASPFQQQNGNQKNEANSFQLPSFELEKEAFDPMTLFQSNPTQNSTPLIERNDDSLPIPKNTPTIEPKNSNDMKNSPTISLENPRMSENNFFQQNESFAKDSTGKESETNTQSITDSPKNRPAVSPLFSTQHKPGTPKAFNLSAIRGTTPVKQLSFSNIKSPVQRVPFNITPTPRFQTTPSPTVPSVTPMVVEQTVPDNQNIVMQEEKPALDIAEVTEPSTKYQQIILPESETLPAPEVTAGVSTPNFFTFENNPVEVPEPLEMFHRNQDRQITLSPTNNPMNLIDSIEATQQYLINTAEEFPRRVEELNQQLQEEEERLKIMCSRVFSLTNEVIAMNCSTLTQKWKDLNAEGKALLMDESL